MPKSETVWQTSVYDKSHYRIGTFHFRNQIDLEKSVNATWAINRNEIKRLDMRDNKTLVWVYAQTNGVAVEAIQIEIHILETWTHF